MNVIVCFTAAGSRGAPSRVFIDRFARCVPAYRNGGSAGAGGRCPHGSAARSRVGERRTMRVLITGGAGFIGSALARAHLERGDEVVVVDSLITGRRDLVP